MIEFVITSHPYLGLGATAKVVTADQTVGIGTKRRKTPSSSPWRHHKTTSHQHSHTHTHTHRDKPAQINNHSPPCTLTLIDTHLTYTLIV